MQLRLTFISLLLFCAVQLSAQEKVYTHCQYAYFKGTKKVATAECYDEAKHWGKAFAYDRSGKVIFEHYLRKVAGHCSVQFDYYEDGAVKQAYVSDAPDGGIQWYRSTTYFDKNGTITNVTKEDHEGPGKDLLTIPPQIHKPTVQPKQTIACAEVYASELWFINTTRYLAHIKAHNNRNEEFELHIKPHDTLKGGSIIGAGHFGPTPFYTFSVTPSGKIAKLRLIVLPSDRLPLEASKTVRRYYYEVHRVL